MHTHSVVCQMAKGMSKSALGSTKHQAGKNLQWDASHRVTEAAEDESTADLISITRKPVRGFLSPCVLTRSAEMLLLDVYDIPQQGLSAAEGKVVPHYWIPLGWTACMSQCICCPCEL